MSLNKGRERITRPTFDKQRGLYQQLRRTFAKQHRVAHLLHPVIRRGSLLLSNPCTAYIRYKALVRRVHRDLPQQLCKIVQHRRHHGRVECVRGFQAPVLYPPSTKRVLKREMAACSPATTQKCALLLAASSIPRSAASHGVNCSRLR